jgi:hypothetical protein
MVECGHLGKVPRSSKRRRKNHSKSMPNSLAPGLMEYGERVTQKLDVDYRKKFTLLDPSLILTRTQYPAIVSNRENRKPFTYARFASVSNAQQPLTAHS